MRLLITLVTALWAGAVSPSHASRAQPSALQRDLSVVAEGPVLVTPVRAVNGSNSGHWLRLDLTGDVAELLAEHVILEHEISCFKAIDSRQTAMCTIWFHRGGDARSDSPEHDGRWKLSDTVIGTSRMGYILGDEDLRWIEISSPALSSWFSQPKGVDIQCASGRCAFVVSRYGAVGALPPSNRPRSSDPHPVE
jgi:hypothetical protein